ncbi:integrin alpha-L-like [Petromyzon marinus]|uniref:integrin alpha-L-like n=1 Tax=Petromyzon marinus TaxID=7757 RepID=UPI003F724CE4
MKLAVMRFSFLTLSLIAGWPLTPCGGYNVDPGTGVVFTAPDRDSGFRSEFGFRVLQQRDNSTGRGWMVVSAPRLRGKSPAPIAPPPSRPAPRPPAPTLYRCDPLKPAEPCEQLDLAGGEVGMTLTADPEGKLFLVCNASREVICSRNRYLKGSCHLYTEDWRLHRALIETQACSAPLVDLVLLLDGSSSLKPEDFTRMMNYTWEIVQESKGTNIQVAVVQFANSVETQLTFTEFQSDSIEVLETKIKDVVQMGGGTNTGLALRHVLSQTFQEQQEARPTALRTLLLITDGTATDVEELQKINKSRALEGITRFVIGVGDVFHKGRAIYTAELIAVARSASTWRWRVTSQHWGESPQGAEGANVRSGG